MTFLCAEADVVRQQSRGHNLVLPAVPGAFTTQAAVRHKPLASHTLNFRRSRQYSVQDVQKIVQCEPEQV